MKHNLLYLLAICCLAGVANAKTSCQKYFSPNHQYSALIENTQVAGAIIPESIVSIYDMHHKLLARKSYTSPDHQHGFGVVQLKWSADSQYCVWSLTSSGGHSPWHFPTDCYAPKCHSIISVDDQLKAGLTQAHFQLKAPHLLISQQLIPHPEGEPEYAKVRFDLDDLKCE